MLLKSYYGMPVNAIPRRDASRAASCARPLAGTLGAPAPPRVRAGSGAGAQCMDAVSTVLRPAPGRCLREPKVVATPSSRNEAAHRDACRLIIVVAGTAVAARDSMRSLPARAGRPARRGPRECPGILRAAAAHAPSPPLPPPPPSGAPKGGCAAHRGPRAVSQPCRRTTRALRSVARAHAHACARLCVRRGGRPGRLPRNPPYKAPAGPPQRLPIGSRDRLRNGTQAGGRRLPDCQKEGRHSARRFRLARRRAAVAVRGPARAAADAAAPSRSASAASPFAPGGAGRAGRAGRRLSQAAPAVRSALRAHRERTASAPRAHCERTASAPRAHRERTARAGPYGRLYVPRP